MAELTGLNIRKPVFYETDTISKLKARLYIYNHISCG